MLQSSPSIEDINKRLQHYQHVFRDPDDVKELSKIRGHTEQEAARAVQVCHGTRKYLGLSSLDDPSSQRRIYLTVQFLVHRLMAPAQQDLVELRSLTMGSSGLFVQLAMELEHKEPSLKGVTPLALSSTMLRICRDVFDLEALAVLVPDERRVNTQFLWFCKELCKIERAIRKLQEEKLGSSETEKRRLAESTGPHSTRIVMTADRQRKRARTNRIEDGIESNIFNPGRLATQAHAAQEPARYKMGTQESDPNLTLTSPSLQQHTSVLSLANSSAATTAAVVEPPKISTTKASGSPTEMENVLQQLVLTTTILKRTEAQLAALEKRLEDVFTNNQGQQITQGIQGLQHVQHIILQNQQEISHKALEDTRKIESTMSNLQLALHSMAQKLDLPARISPQSRYEHPYSIHYPGETTSQGPNVITSATMPLRYPPQPQNQLLGHRPA